MKKFTLLSLLILICCCFQVKAQQYVTTEPTNKNVVLEEFTGKNCGWCPAGHLIANQISEANPGRFWAVNVHAGFMSPTSYPNFNTAKSTIIDNKFNGSSYPTGVVNRSTTVAQSRGQWASLTNAQLAMPSCANIGGVCIIDPATRIATINIEIYYTSNGTGNSNKVTIAMLQNNVLGFQNGMSDNPSQIIGGQYNHMHALRDIITNTWGDEVTNISQGSLVELTYTYEIPEIIGDPNGINVVLEDLEFLVWVAETDYNIITANELEVIFGSDKPINPAIKTLKQVEGIYCGNIRPIETEILNGGLDDITSLEVEIDLDGEITTQVIEENIPSYTKATIGFDIEVSESEHTLTFTIIKINGEEIEQNNSTTKEITITSAEWSAVDGIIQSITLRIWQDRFGNQIKWKFLSSNLEVIAEGGPYTILPEPGTRLHEHVIPITSDDCIQLVMTDLAGNGFNNGNGEGHYELEDSNGNIIFESDATFTKEEITNYSVRVTLGIDENNNNVIIYPNPASDHIIVSDIENIKAINIYDISGKTVYQTNNISKEINISAFNSGIYFIRLFMEDGSMINEKLIKE